jgi:ATP-dependent exoDNAse (exonuclease V) alpha subunit
MRLTQGQERARRLALTTSASLFITGSAGTGKTVVLRQIIKDLTAAGQNVVTSAFTGLAALQLEGSTLSRLLGLGIAKRKSDLRGSLFHVRMRTEENLGNADVLVIDEVSMLSGDYLELVDSVLRMALNKDKPFGGLRIIFCGDFLQLPPVKGYQDPKFRIKWAFQYSAFKKVRSIVLTEGVRQGRSDDLNLLNEIREGRMTNLTKLFIQASVNRWVEGAVELYPRNKEVQEINRDRLEELRGVSQTYAVKYESLEACESMSKALPINARVELKVGAPVIVMANEPKIGYCNGTQGRVVDMEPERVTIKTLSGQILPVIPHVWKMDLGYGDSSSRSCGHAIGMPLKLGWAATIHKSQGLTLERVRTDISGCWEPGHAYVALSRATSMLNVSLVCPFKKVLADPEALRFTQSLR